MTLLFTFRMVIRALSHHKGRSFLTVLGIVIGITGVVAITAIGRGSQKKARDQILSFGSKSIGFSMGNPNAKNVTKPPKPITLEEINAIKQQCPKIEHLSPCIWQHNCSIEYDGKLFSGRLQGVRENYLTINEQTMQSGGFFTKHHNERGDCVVVIDDIARENIFKYNDPIGKIIRLNKIPFTIIGVRAPPKIKSKWDSEQIRVYIPFIVAYNYFMFDKSQLGFEVSTYHEKDSVEVTRQVTRILRSMHHLEDDEPNDFMSFDAQVMAEVAEKGAMIIAMFALIAAAIALLVGGIGVMNIMLVAVKERTKEIGIKMALGAPQKLILRQFLFESITLSALGGLIGILIGVTLSFLLARYTDLPAIVEITPVLIAFIITLLIGVFFGYYPAFKASRLNPVEALVDQ